MIWRIESSQRVKALNRKKQWNTYPIFRLWFFRHSHSTHKVQANSLGFYTVKPIFVLLSWKSKEAKQCTLDVGMSTSKLLNSKYRHQTQSLDLTWIQLLGFTVQIVDGIAVLLTQHKTKECTQKWEGLFLLLKKASEEAAS